MEMTYLTILRKLFEYTGLGLADAGASATTALEAAGFTLNYQAADEVAYRLTKATAIVGRDWDQADAETRRMLLHVAELPSGTLNYLAQVATHPAAGTPAATRPGPRAEPPAVPPMGSGPAPGEGPAGEGTRGSP